MYCQNDAVNDTTRRVQLLVTKLIQNLANDVPFDGRKEEHMKAFNAFINESNQRLLQAYVAALTVCIRATPTHSTHQGRSARNTQHATRNTHVC
jgi:hypothetical protein